ncbi:WD40/YVTN/BNR-like repeat-containing protein [Tautonia plasticadhaerens]|uniref:WD40/YVTN/BNR-like repeat-containing protein n=1 Tax=Tautonia plasticadhaerens TaxID=2527974 RepID=UPI0018D1FA90|nr:YCF48-related protein [Tautonia plasticadhaerens]
MVALIGLLAGPESRVAAGPIGWAVGDLGTILHTTDGGANWSPQVSNTTDFLSTVDFIDANTGWTVGGNHSGPGNSILHTADGGATWTAQDIGTTTFLTGVDFLPAAIPEPGSMMLVASGLGSLALACWTRRRRG